MVKHVLAESGILLRPEDKVSPGMEDGLCSRYEHQSHTRNI